MFTGIIEGLGVVKNILRQANASLLQIEAVQAAQGAAIGESVAVNGACLTVVRIDGACLSFQAIPETLAATNLQYLKPGDKVNIERALKAGERISGHFVGGHIDCLGVIRSRKIVNGNLVLQVAVPEQFSRFLLPKGSIALDGVSLTLAQVKGNSFSVNIIPHTAKNTTLGLARASSRPNIEFDLLVKSAAQKHAQGL